MVAYAQPRGKILAGPKDLAAATMQRNMFSSKLENGKVMIVGGSEDYHGAPALASTAAYNLLAALRVGAGYATAFVPRSILTPNRAVSPNVIVRQLSRSNLSAADLPLLKASMRHFDSLVVGMGIGRSSESANAASKLIAYALKTGKATVIDADAIYAVSRYRVRLNDNAIIMPNEREFELLYSGRIRKNALAERIRASAELAKRLNTNILLKGHDTIITDGKRTKVVRARHAALAVMGTGDVLSGIVGAYAAKTGDAFASGVAGAYLHATIGDRLYKEKGNHILASDVVDYIPKILKRHDRRR
jgi:NAD(P)H-hydrate epimerase